MPLTLCRRKHIHDATNVHVENYIGDHDVKFDNSHVDVHFDNAHGDVQHIDDVFTESLKEIIHSHEIKWKMSLESIYSKLMDIFELARIENETELPGAKYHLANEHIVSVNASCEDNTVSSDVIQNTPIASVDGSRSTKNIAIGS